MDIIQPGPFTTSQMREEDIEVLTANIPVHPDFLWKSRIQIQSFRKTPHSLEGDKFTRVPDRCSMVTRTLSEHVI